jgi:hypothetical protein
LIPLAACVGLHTLDVRGCEGINDLTPLAACVRLHTLEGRMGEERKGEWERRGKK